MPSAIRTLFAAMALLGLAEAARTEPARAATIDGQDGAASGRPDIRSIKMSEELRYQIRLNISDDYAELARTDPQNAALAPIAAILAKHHAALSNQFDAFAHYVAEAEKQGVEHFPLYKWTKATIEDPVKKAKHVKSFSLYVEGEEVYPKAAADALEADLTPFVGGGVVEKLSKHDTDPAHNPQAPAHLR
ncbi:hypothetical protein EDE12_10767 [Methylosinus sp. sav-2]|uniref:hypothetical protein n=1 Tax=unclassified Methylosinus TaxID=2624500 RepID=UPI0004BA12F9|nr:hypothetical protein EDE12_10767 [Methylosinus sp. sav-2]